MKLILHIIAKDFLFLRGRLAAWLAVLVAKFAIGFWLVLRADVSDRALIAIQGGVAGLIVVDLALTLLLGALLVQEDAVAGSAAFWRTRPISPRRLLAAKILGAGLLLVVPAVVVALPWWWVTGLELGQIGLAALEVILVQGLVLMVAFTAASLTDTLGRCFVWGLVGAVVVQAIAGGWRYWWVKLTGTALRGEEVLLHGVLAVGVMGGVVLWQYLTRRTKIGLFGLGFGAVAITPVALWVGARIPTAAQAATAVRADDRPDLTREIAIAWDSAVIRPAQGRRGALYLDVNYESRGVPPGYVLTGRSAAYEFQWSGLPGPKPRNRGLRGENIGEATARLVRDPNGLGGQRSRTARVALMVEGDEQFAERLRTEEVGLTVNLVFDAVAPKVLLTVPAAPGPWQAQGGRGLRVVQTGRSGTDRVAVLLESEPQAFLELAWNELFRRPTPRQSFLYAVLRPGYDVASTRFGRSLSGVLLGGVQLRQRSFDVEPWGNGPEGGAAETSKSKIVLVDLTESATFRREVVVPRLQLK